MYADLLKDGAAASATDSLEDAFAIGTLITGVRVR
jgi:hypothetical protein